jgi:putative transposase
VADKRRLIEPAHPHIALARQCALLDLARSSYYYRPQPQSQENLLLMRLLDEQYTKTPYYGIRKMTQRLQQTGYPVNHKRVRRLLRRMGLFPIYPKPALSTPAPDHKVYPYLLGGIKIERVNQVWSCDIPYVPMAQDFVYLFAVMDWFSRFVLSWSVSVSLEGPFCLDALDAALIENQPAIFNSDQGSQFTSEAFTSRLLARDIAIRMDGRGRALDNIFVERLWRTAKYEEVSLKAYQTVPTAVASLGAYFRFYNEERLHQSLGYRTPAAIYRAGITEGTGA